MRTHRQLLTRESSNTSTTHNTNMSGVLLRTLDVVIGGEMKGYAKVQHEGQGGSSSCLPACAQHTCLYGSFPKLLFPKWGEIYIGPRIIGNLDQSPYIRSMICPTTGVMLRDFRLPNTSREQASLRPRLERGTQLLLEHGKTTGGLTIL